MGPCRHGARGLLAAFPFPLVLGFGRFNRLPLHVGGRIGSPASKRIDMVYHISGAGAASLSGGRTGVPLLKCILGRFAPFFPSAMGAANTPKARR